MSSDWKLLPKHLVGLILEKLVSVKDKLQVGAVCGTWFSVLKDYQTKLDEIDLSHQVPMLLIPNEKELTWNLFDATTNRIVKSELVIPYSRRFSGSSRGWLVTVYEDFSVTLHKPCAMDIDGIVSMIDLPCLFPPDPEDEEIFQALKDDCDYHVFKATITADPIANPDDSILFVIFGECRDLAFIKPGAKEPVWTSIDLEREYFDDILFCSDKDIYAIDTRGQLISFDIVDPYNPNEKLVAGKTSSDINSLVKTYLVKLPGEEILLVERYMDFDDNDVRVTSKVKVFKLDFHEPIESRWVELKDLGDVALFLGDNSSVSVVASNFVGIEPNCIYCTHDFETEGYCECGPCDMGVFDLGTQEFRVQYPVDSKLIIRMNEQPPLWFVPTHNRY